MCGVRMLLHPATLPAAGGVWRLILCGQGTVWCRMFACATHTFPHVCLRVRVCLLQAVLRSHGNQVWEKGDNHKAKLQGSQDVSLYHEFRA